MKIKTWVGKRREANYQSRSILMSVAKAAMACTLSAALMAGQAGVATAAPMPTNFATMKSMVAAGPTDVRWRARWGLEAGLLAGVIIGGAIAGGPYGYYGAAYPYYGYRYPYYRYYYDYPRVVYCYPSYPGPPGPYRVRYYGDDRCYW